MKRSLIIFLLFVLLCLITVFAECDDATSSWMRVYTTGRQPLTAYPEGTAIDPTGHLVGTDVAVTPGGDIMVAAYVDDPGSPAACVALGCIARYGSVVWSREYFPIEPSRSPNPQYSPFSFGIWARLVALFHHDDVAFALAFANDLLLLDKGGYTKQTLSFPEISQITGLLALPNGELILIGVGGSPSPPARGASVVHVLRLAFPRGEEPKTLWGRRIDGLKSDWEKPYPRPEVVRTVDEDGEGYLWVGGAKDFLTCLSEKGEMLGAWKLASKKATIHNGHGIVRQLEYGALATDQQGHLFFGGSLRIKSKYTSAISHFPFVACLTPDPTKMNLVWAHTLTENTGYGGDSSVHTLRTASGDLFMTGDTSQWGQDEGNFNKAAYAARLGTDGSVTWVRLLGRKKQSGGQVEYSNDLGHAIVPTGNGSAVLVGGTSSFSHPEPWRQQVNEAAIEHPELLVVYLGTGGEVGNIGFGRHPNLGLAPELGDHQNQVDVLTLELTVEKADLSVEEITATVETVTFGTRDGGWVERQLRGQRNPGDGPPTAVIHLPIKEDDFWENFVWLDGSESSDPEGETIVRYEWKFGDGKTYTSAFPEVSHKYQKGGKYELTLSVTDEQGYEGTTSRWILVGESIRGAAYPAAFCPEKTTTYQIEVLTGDVDGADTNAEVSFSLVSSANENGDREGTGDIFLDNENCIFRGTDLFQRGALDSFRVPNIPQVRDVDYATLRHKGGGNRPTWQVVGLQVTDTTTNNKWLFMPERWLATDKPPDQRTWARLVPVSLFPAGILFGEETLSHELTAASDNVFVLPAGCTEFYITSLYRGLMVTVLSEEGNFIGRYKSEGSEALRFPYLQETDWGVEVKAKDITCPTALTVQLENSGDQSTRVWVFPSAWEGYEREARALALLLPLRDQTEEMYGARQTEPISNIVKFKRFLNSFGDSTAIYTAAMKPILPYAAQAIGIFGALPDDVLSGYISAEVGIFVTDRLRDALSVVAVGGRLADGLVSEFAGLLTSMLSAFTWALGSESVMEEGANAAGTCDMLSVLPETDGLFKRVEPLWKDIEVDLRAIVGTDGLAWNNDANGTREKLNHIRTLAVGRNPCDPSSYDYTYKEGENTDIAVWSLAAVLLFELNNVNNWSEEAPTWYSAYVRGTLGANLGSDLDGEARAAKPTYLPIWEDIIRISSVVINASLLSCGEEQ